MSIEYRVKSFQHRSPSTVIYHLAGNNLELARQMMQIDTDKFHHQLEQRQVADWYLARMPGPKCKLDLHEDQGACYICCDECNYDRHICHFCGTNLKHNSYEYSGKRHYLSDCRPDLIDGSYDGTHMEDGPMV